jgi:hypothetical protein
MIYGKRIYESQPHKSQHRPQKFILNKAFQFKYTWYLMTAVTGSAVLFFAPAYYFIQQNYQLFVTLAYDTQPTLVNHLERELVWMAIFMALSLGIIMGLTLVIGLRMTKNLLAPLVQMEKHMKELMYGHWYIPDYKISHEDDFRDLALTYDYFYRSLKVNTETELKLIEKFSIDPHNREAYAAWKNLIMIKRSRLGTQDTPFEEFNVQALSAQGPQFKHDMPIPAPSAPTAPSASVVTSIAAARPRRAS